ncbi:MAG: ankyrin repeat domain-containing protein [Cyanobacteriota bacterium]
MQKIVLVSFLILGTLIVNPIFTQKAFSAPETETKDSNKSDINNDLVNAVASADLVKVKELLSKGADINFKDQADLSLLMYAVIINNKDMVDFILSNIKDINFKNKDNFTALMYASDSSSSEIVKLLISKGSKMDDAFVIAVPSKIDTLKKIDIFLENGYDINTKDKDGLTALMIAEVASSKEIIEYLKSKGAK